MKNIDVFKNGNAEEIADVLCSMINNMPTNPKDDNNCEICPATNYCKIGHTGFIDWLETEQDDNRRTD